MKLEDQRTGKLPQDFKVDDEVVYIPKHLLMGSKSEMVKDENLGIVTSINDLYVFVRYLGNTSSQATIADDLFWINNRPDLQEKLRALQNKLTTLEEINNRIKE